AMRRNIVKGPPPQVPNDRLGPRRRPSRADVIAVSLSAIGSPPDVFSERTVFTKLLGASYPASAAVGRQSGNCEEKHPPTKTIESDDQEMQSVFSRAQVLTGEQSDQQSSIEYQQFSRGFRL